MDLSTCARSFTSCIKILLFLHILPNNLDINTYKTLILPVVQDTCAFFKKRMHAKVVQNSILRDQVSM